MKRLITAAAALLLTTCDNTQAPVTAAEMTDRTAPVVLEARDEPVSRREAVAQVDRFADIQILDFEVPGFDQLPLQQKKLAYYLSQAALAGRDIIYDQNYRYNLRIRKLLSAVVSSYSGDRSETDFKQLHEYARRVWFANGIHHHYSSDKMLPGFTPEALAKMVKQSSASLLPLEDGQTVEDLLQILHDPIFDPATAAKKVVLDPDVDQLSASATNYYRNVTAAEATAFYAAKTDEDPERPVSWGLNSQLAKIDGKLVERTWKVGGMYGSAIEQIVRWLELATTVAENDLQRTWIEKLIKFYRTGSLEDYDDYLIAWVADSTSRVDSVNGFTEVYGDPLGYRGAWEATVSIRDLDAARRIATIAGQAQWFEDHSTIMDEHKKKNVVGISAKVITIVVQGGDTAPSSPIGINLPNPNWIRKEYGSKSVTLGNIISSYQSATAASGLTEEFAYTNKEKERAKKYGELAQLLDVDLHEVIGHASGQINPGVGIPADTLKTYSSTLEEARADLAALYYIMDPKLVELGLMPSLDVGKTSYDKNIRNGLQMQLRRIEPGDDIEQAHMRERQLISTWAFEKGQPENIIEKIVENGKTYFVINDYDALRTLFGELLHEIQRIKSEGDYEAGMNLVETYGVRVDRAMHREVLARVAPLNIAAYSGFVQPRLVTHEKNGEIIDITLEYVDDFTAQMLEYERNYSFLPLVN